MFTNDSRFALVPATVKEAITKALQADVDTYVLREVYEWLGYSTYQNAQTSFYNCGFAETLDFTIVMDFHKNGFGQRKIENICMTADCFKAFAMQARTERGKQVRLYFIECERQLKQVMQQPYRNISRAELLDLAFESLERERALYKSKQPGLISYFEDVVSDSKALEPECKTARELASDSDYEFTNGQLSALGRYLTSFYVQMHRSEPKQKYESGRMVNCYPHYMWNALETFVNRQDN